MDAHVKRDMDDVFTDTEVTVTLLAAAISACNPIVAHVLHMHERARVRTAVEATEAATANYSDSCSDHLAVCACSCCAYEQELRLLTDISTLNTAPPEANAQVTTPPTPYPPFATVSEARIQNPEQQPNTGAKTSQVTSSVFGIFTGVELSHINLRMVDSTADMHTLGFTLLEHADHEIVENDYAVGVVAFHINSKYVVREYYDLRRFYSTTPRKRNLLEHVEFSVMNAPFRPLRVANVLCKSITTPMHVPEPARRNFSRHKHLRLAREEMRVLQKRPPPNMLLRLAEIRHARMRNYVETHAVRRGAS
ncbi:hypothetical protein CYMTET_3094 [Cymbomonas tetramitiformis]|uniref:Uncharacterized protein n=1 Tax=Cymbomonas tetramitiformis TaxID=36881 RepID=A0AAE0H3Z9_9CHLO|nr:hypothetical protein CYMTET_3094 [Cymbomonas tetramitiformis]